MSAVLFVDKYFLIFPVMVVLCAVELFWPSRWQINQTHRSKTSTHTQNVYDPKSNRRNGNRISMKRLNLFGDFVLCALDGAESGANGMHWLQIRKGAEFPLWSTVDRAEGFFLRAE